MRKTTYLALTVGLAVALVGCSKMAHLTSGGSDTALSGTWKGSFEDNSASSKDKSNLGAAMGNAFMSMFNFKLKFKEGDAYELSMMGIPVAGHYTQSGNHLTFKPETIMGQTPDEFKKTMAEQKGAATMNQDDIGKPMEADLSADGKTITVVGGSGLGGHQSTDTGKMVFKKEEGSDKPAAMLLKTDAEKALVGTFKGAIKMPAVPGESADDASKRKMAEMFGSSSELELKTDYTFRMQFMLELQGTWSLSGNELVLEPDASKMFGGAGSTTGSKSQSMKFTESSDGRTLTSEDTSKGQLTFTKP